MGLKIIANGIELDYVKESLKLKRDNNAMIRDFRINYSSNPFLLIENTKLIKALGSIDLKSINRTKTIAVQVIEADFSYPGELQILTSIKGYRKSNLKYATELIAIVNEKIADLMPTVSVIPDETNPVPFSETSKAIVSGYTNWEDYPISFISQGFPAVKWNFPTLYWFNKFGIELAPTDDHFAYQQEINKYNSDLDAFILNTYAIDGSDVLTVSNKNVSSPQVYLLSPLYYALNSLGWKIKGNFYENDFVKKLLIFSQNTNDTQVKMFGSIHNYNLAAISWVGSDIGTATERYTKTSAFSVSDLGVYTFEYSFDLTGPFSNENYQIYIVPPLENGNTVIRVTSQESSSQTYSGSVEITANNVGIFIVFLIVKSTSRISNYSVISKKNKDNLFIMPHPTIQLGRFLPDWTFGTYLNELKNFFNLDIEINDFDKTMTINFFENVLKSETPLVLKNSLLNETFDINPTQAFILKYSNSEDTALFITATGSEIYTNQNNDFLETLSSKFKLMPLNGYTAKLSEDIVGKDGVGLMIYDENNKPYISSQFNGQNLEINGSGGIYESFWKTTLRFRLNASIVELNGIYSKTEVSKLIRANTIYVNRQEFIVESVEYSETKGGNFALKFKVHSKTL